MGRNSVASQVVDALVAAGVQRVYGLVGDSLNPFVDALRRTEGIDEESAAFAAGRIVLAGGVGRMVDMARSNLRNIPRP
ncbi:thiamine pyrophosphate-binding protein [Nocardia sp. NPDC059764]|uniref:thiamine pyrophosphate-binding protein n=1 Tax=Nocardia sp. NPDC059764 TaxID=3346939 RepID=UPI00366A45C4